MSTYFYKGALSEVCLGILNSYRAASWVMGGQGGTVFHGVIGDQGGTVFHGVIGDQGGTVFHGVMGKLGF